RNAECQLAARHIAATRDAVLAVLLRRSRVEDHRLLARLEPSVQLGCLDGGDLILDLETLAELLTRYVHAPLGGQPQAGPAVDAAIQDRDAGVAHALDGPGGHCRPPSIIVAQDDLNGPARDEPLESELDQPPRKGARAGDVRGVVLAMLPDV